MVRICSKMVCFCTIKMVLTYLQRIFNILAGNRNPELHHIETDFKTDYKRIAHLLSNLLTDAITHGEKGKPIIINLEEIDEIKKLLAIWVSKFPLKIPLNLFKPFSRSKINQDRRILDSFYLLQRESFLRIRAK